MAFDLALSMGVLACAALALTTPDRTSAVAGFVVMGLFVALSWVRLGAPDVALAEAAIGAGLTGALLLRAAHRLGPLRGAARLSRDLSLVAGFLSAGLALGLTWAFVTAEVPALYPPLVADSLNQSGVTNPVTAVLLNYRAWDTALEVAVLVAALFLLRLLSAHRVVPAQLGQLVLPFARIVVPLTILVAGHLLWRGASAPGGAFQAGAVLAGGLLALGLCGLAPTGPRMRSIGLALGLSGLAVFTLAALASETLSGHFLGYPQGAEKAWIIAIEAALTLSIAATLCLLFTGTDRRSPS